ncbi:Uncharacterized protein TCM_035484 [Theobroma cacao]|uniref:DUF4219 domain-containing protein n=1 Tax=Theobroma cacao TaxID=3641 RepID=A0A061FQ95_THECC|nr:Uncharacterized protein TCM_035484 [Theobroma cacao]
MDVVVAKRQSTNRQPLFDGSNYPYWSTRMSIYIRPIDYEMWDVITDGPFIPSTKNVMTNEMISKSRGIRETCEFIAFISHIEPKSFEEAEKEESWILAMQEELEQFERNHVWTLVFRSFNHLIVGTKWVFRNKVNEQDLCKNFAEESKVNSK